MSYKAEMYVESAGGENRRWNLFVAGRKDGRAAYAGAWETLPDRGDGFVSFDLFGCRKCSLPLPEVRSMTDKAAAAAMVRLAEKMHADGFIEEHALDKVRARFGANATQGRRATV
jgi:hypothetical protein